MKKLIEQWNEVFLTLILLVLWPVSGHMIRWIDPTAAVFDAGVLQTIYIAFMAIAILGLFTYLGIKFNWPFLYEYCESGLKSDFISLPPIQKVCISLSFFSALFFVGALIFMAVTGLA